MRTIRKGRASGFTVTRNLRSGAGSFDGIVDIGLRMLAEAGRLISQQLEPQALPDRR